MSWAFCGYNFVVQIGPITHKKIIILNFTQNFWFATPKTPSNWCGQILREYYNFQTAGNLFLNQLNIRRNFFVNFISIYFVCLNQLFYLYKRFFKFNIAKKVSKISTYILIIPLLSICKKIDRENINCRIQFHLQKYYCFFISF